MYIQVNLGHLQVIFKHSVLTFMRWGLNRADRLPCYSWVCFKTKMDDQWYFGQRIESTLLAKNMAILGKYKCGQWQFWTNINVDNVDEIFIRIKPHICTSSAWAPAAWPSLIQTWIQNEELMNWYCNWNQCSGSRHLCKNNDSICDVTSCDSQPSFHYSWMTFGDSG